MSEFFMRVCSAWISVIVCICTISYASENQEQFYVIGCGQGNSQIAIYDNIGVIYDAGSASHQIHHKFKVMQNEQFSPVFYKVQSGESNSENNLEFDIDISDLLKEEGDSDISSIPSIRDRGGSNASSRISNEISTSNDRRDIIVNIIRVNNLKHIFCFISHPDSDHYSYLLNNSNGVNILPQDIPVTLFLCGDWLGEYGHQRRELIKQVANQNNVWFELPYYWEYKGGKERKQANYSSLISYFKNMVSQSSSDDPSSFNPFDLLLKKNLPNNVEKLFQGSLYELIRELKIKYSNCEKFNRPAA